MRTLDEVLEYHAPKYCTAVHIPYDELSAYNCSTAESIRSTRTRIYAAAVHAYDIYMHVTRTLLWVFRGIFANMQ